MVSQISSTTDNGNIYVTFPQLEETNSILKNINSKELYAVTLQNDKELKIHITNEPTYLDYMTSFGTIGAVLISLLLGVIFPFFNKIRNIWIGRTKLKVKFIEYFCDEKNGKSPKIFIHFENMYKFALDIKNILFFIEFKGHVLPIILRLNSLDNLMLPQLSEERRDFYIADDYVSKKPKALKDEQEILNFINERHVMRNKVSPYDDIKNTYIVVETNIGQIKINIPKWMRETSCDEIIGLYMKDVFAIPGIYEGNDYEKQIMNLRDGIKEVSRRVKKGKKERRKELRKWMWEDFLCYVPLDTLYDRIKIRLQRLSNKYKKKKK